MCVHGPTFDSHGVINIAHVQTCEQLVSVLPCVMIYYLLLSADQQNFFQGEILFVSFGSALQSVKLFCYQTLCPIL